MTPKEKAQELVSKLQSFADTYHYGNLANAKQCALIAVDEILNLSYFTYDPNEDDSLYMNYWKQVKAEIEKL